MTTDYIVSARGDLDGLFMPRTSTAIADTGFKSNGGVDLAQRFEPRGATTAIANTNFKAGANDLATLFKDINAAPVLITLTMVAGRGTADVAMVTPHPDGSRSIASDPNRPAMLTSLAATQAPVPASWASRRTSPPSRSHRH